MLYLGEKITVFDGGFGSELERRGIFCQTPEDLNIDNAEAVKSIHRAYSCADVATANTFGLNPIKYRGKYSLREVALRAVENARVSKKPVLFDVGPTGAMLEPVGKLGFEEAYEAFKTVAEISRDIADGYILETFSDIYELKAAILAFKENSALPVFATATFDASGRTLTGSTPEIVANTVSGLGADALGVNCSLGPKELLPIVKRLLDATSLPVIVQPNRGLPEIENGRTVYRLGAEEFEYYIEKMVEMGVSAVGGCCGTTPEFIERIAKFSGQSVKKREHIAAAAVNSANRLCVIDGVKICGERLNPTGKKALKEALINGDLDYLADEAIKQQEAGADILDINAGLPQIDEKALMPKIIKRVQEYCDLPLQIDSSNAEAIEAAARVCNGIPLINSVNGDDEVMARIFPIAKKYGAVVLGLAMDKNGVPETAEKRVEIAKRIIKRAAEFGIPKHRIIIDTLVVTASAEQRLVKETLSALEAVSRLGVKTALGVSNVSFGLPNRPLLNRTFLTMALERGLNMPIMNPLDGEMTGAVKAFALLSGLDENAEDYIETYKDFSPSAAQALKKEKSERTANTLFDCVKLGLKNRAGHLAEEELKIREPLEVVNEVLIKALDEVGRLYEQGKLFLPQLISSAEAAKAAFKVVSEKLGSRAEPKGKVVLATVRGDVHDIGKNIVKVVIESYGWKTIDLGKDVSTEEVVKAVAENDPDAVGLSALMTTTVPSMEATIKALREAGCRAKIFVGGAVLNPETAARIGADYYTKDALEMAKKLDEVRGKEMKRPAKMTSDG